MNARELVDHIRSCPAELVLDKPLRFRRRTRSNPCDFNEFLQALQSSETIRDVRCSSHHTLGITEDEWVLLVKKIGRIRDIRNLEVWCRAASRDFHPFQAVADVVKIAGSLFKQRIRIEGQTFPRDPSGLTALANALREHTALQEFRWFDFVSRTEAAPLEVCPDFTLRALAACSHLRKVVITTQCASSGAVKTLLQLPKDTHLILILNTQYWLAVADGIRQGECNIKNLNLCLLPQSSRSTHVYTEAVKAIAGAIRLDRNLKRLQLDIMNGFADEAGVAMAEALTANKTLRKVTLFVEPFRGDQVQDTDAMGAPAYDAFSAMLRVNTSLRLELPPLSFNVRDERLIDSHNQMRIEQRLNKVGRGRLLASSQTPREEWVDALQELNARNVDVAFNVSCLYSLLLLHPDVCMLEVNDTTNPGSMYSS